jgi:site-specific recombinase XerC
MSSDAAHLPAEATPSPSPVMPSAEIAAAVRFARAEKAEATRRAYRTDFEIFRLWCAERRVANLPATAETVATVLAFEASRAIKPSTIARRVAAIRYTHKLASHEPPTNAETVRATLRGIRRTMGTAPIRKAPITAEWVRAMAATTPDTLAGLRDRSESENRTHGAKKIGPGQYLDFFNRIGHEPTSRQRSHIT